MTTQTQGLAQPVPPMPSAAAGSQPPHVMPRAGGREGVAPLRSNPAQLLHLVLFIAGAVLLPAGLIVIGLGWYGVAHTPYVYNQNAYIVSGGLLGLGITFVGGFLYFGSWLARVAADQKEAQRQLSDTLLLLADAVSHNTAVASGSRPAARPRDPGSVLVTAGNGTTVHRADCDLVAGREDLRPAGADAPNLTRCRLCMK
ncbi:MAG: hypothetical protein JF565_04000 [Propionibacteriales bacterium]|jgi:hypothetical protein|nr:hypothetical protein [Propionibacteriales bacterium]